MTLPGSFPAFLSEIGKKHESGERHRSNIHLNAMTALPLKMALVLGQARNHGSFLPDRVVAEVDCRGNLVRRVEMSRGAISLGDGRLCGTSSRMSDGRG
jgi:hypothetical protein